MNHGVAGGFLSVAIPAEALVGGGSAGAPKNLRCAHSSCATDPVLRELGARSGGEN